MDARSYLGRSVRVVIDRPLGSRHPVHGFVYPVNYGYLPGTRSGDGEPLDAYVLGPETPLAAFTGRCVAVLRRLDEADDKLIVVPGGADPGDAWILARIQFQERWFRSELVRA